MVRYFSDYADIDLFPLVKEGNTKAFDEIYDRYWEKLFNYAFSHTQSKYAAFEIVQDIFVSLWAHKEVIKLQNSLSGCLFASVRFQVINYIRNGKLKEHYVKDYVRFTSFADNSNEGSIMMHDLRDALEQSIGKIPERCREITKLSYV